MAIGGFGKGALAGLATWGAGRLSPQTPAQTSKGGVPADASSFLNILIKLREDERARKRLSESIATNKLTREKTQLGIKAEKEKAREKKAKGRLEEKLRGIYAQQVEEGLKPGVEPVMQLHRTIPAYDAQVNEDTGEAKLRFALNPENPAVMREEATPGTPAGNWRKILGETLSDALREQAKISPKKAYEEAFRVVSEAGKTERTAAAEDVKRKKEFDDWLRKEGIKNKFDMATFKEKQAILDRYRRGIIAAAAASGLSAYETKLALQSADELEDALTGLKSVGKDFEVVWEQADTTPRYDKNGNQLPPLVPTAKVVRKDKSRATGGWASMTPAQQSAMLEKAAKAFADISAAEIGLSRKTAKGKPVRNTLVNGRDWTRDTLREKRATFDLLYGKYPELKEILRKAKIGGEKGGKKTASDWASEAK